MKRILLSCLGLALGAALFGQQKMFIHKSDNVTLEEAVSETDSVYFTDLGANIYFKIGDNILKYNITEIDSITFGEYISSMIYIIYNGSTVTVINPLADAGVAITTSGADVTVTSTSETKDIYYNVSGTTTDGTLKMYSEKRFNLVLNGASITNADGPAINIQSGKKVLLTLMDGTTSYLADGSSYADSSLASDGTYEDQKAAFFSEGEIVAAGSGSLTIKGNASDKHALCCDEVIEVDNGTITVSSAGKDGIHGKDGIIITGGTVNVTSTGDGIDGASGCVQISGGSVTTSSTAADMVGITSDTTVSISGGTVTVTVSGNQSKGIASDMGMDLSSGTITVNTSGAAVLEASGSGYDPAYCTAIKSDSTVTISGASVTITTTGLGGKGISSNYLVNISSGTVSIKCSGNGATYTNSEATTDAYNSTCISSDGDITILGGAVTASNSGSGGKGISCDGALTIGDGSSSPSINVTTTGTEVTSSTKGGPSGNTGGSTSTTTSTSYSSPKAVKSTGAATINSGTVYITSADDGVKSEASITVNGGTVTVSQSYEAFEAPYITINGGSTTLTASNDGINATQGTTSGGTESNDGSLFKVTGGTISVFGADAVDSNGNIEMTGGTLIVGQLATGTSGPSTPEEGVDFNGAFTMNGGYCISAGSSSGNSMSSSSSQYNVTITSNSVISSSTYLRIQDGSGNEILTFVPKYGGYKFLFSSSSLKSGSTYYIYTGGSYTGGTSTNGLYTGGTYSGGTQKTSFTVNSKVTSVSL